MNHRQTDKLLDPYSIDGKFEFLYTSPGSSFSGFIKLFLAHVFSGENLYSFQVSLQEFVHIFGQEYRTSMQTDTSFYVKGYIIYKCKQ